MCVVGLCLVLLVHVAAAFIVGLAALTLLPSLCCPQPAMSQPRPQIHTHTFNLLLSLGVLAYAIVTALWVLL